MEVIYRCDPFSVSGYARAARANMRALIEAGVDVIIEPNRKDSIDCGLDNFWQEEMPKRLSKGTRGAKIKIWHETPGFYEPEPSLINIAYLAWETSRISNTDVGGNPRMNWAAQLNRMNQVWVPCNQNKWALERSGVKTPIHVVPHPIRSEEHDPTARPYIPKEDVLTLVSIFQWTPRKDPLTLLLGVYGTIARANLIAKIYGVDFSFGQGELVQRIQETKRAFHKEPPNKVVPVLSQFHDCEMQGLYTSGDAYITTSRGEGFCLPALEAMATGLPVIAPSGTAFADFLTDSNSYILEYDLQPVFAVGQMPPWYGPDQRWMQVSVDHLQEVLVQVESDRKSGVLKRKGTEARRTVASLFDPQKIGQQMHQLLTELEAGHSNTAGLPEAAHHV